MQCVVLGHFSFMCKNSVASGCNKRTYSLFVTVIKYLKQTAYEGTRFILARSFGSSQSKMGQAPLVQLGEMMWLLADSTLVRGRACVCVSPPRVP